MHSHFYHLQDNIKVFLISASKEQFTRAHTRVYMMHLNDAKNLCLFDHVLVYKKIQTKWIRVYSPDDIDKEFEIRLCVPVATILDH